MNISIVRQKDVLGKGKGYLIGFDNNFIIEGSMINLDTKKVAEKFATNINSLINTEKFKCFNDMFNVILNEYNNCYDAIQDKNKIMDILRLEYFELFKQGLLKPIGNDKQLIEFAKENKEKLINKIDNIDYFLEYCI